MLRGPQLRGPSPAVCRRPGLFLRLPTVAADPGFFPANGPPGALLVLLPCPLDTGRTRRLVLIRLERHPVTVFSQAPSANGAMPPNEMAVATRTS